MHSEGKPSIRFGTSGWSGSMNLTVPVAAKKVQKTPSCLILPISLML
ncbi:hypothetical protein JCM19233_22 [Vibrio astriarenae]|nr:hypothetical protein JCM19233_22 [Vibrio sp. C7]